MVDWLDYPVSWRMESAICKAQGMDPQGEKPIFTRGLRMTASSYLPIAIPAEGTGKVRLQGQLTSRLFLEGKHEGYGEFRHHRYVQSAGSTLATRSLSSFPGLNFTTARAGMATGASGLFGFLPIFGFVFVT